MGSCTQRKMSPPAPPAIRTFSDTNADDGVDEAQFEVLSVSRRARSKLHAWTFSFRSRRRGAAVGKPLSGSQGDTPILVCTSMILKRTAEGSPIDAFLSKMPASIPSRPSNSKSQRVLYRTALLPISHCHFSGTPSFQVNPCSVREQITSDRLKKSIHC